MIRSGKSAAVALVAVLLSLATASAQQPGISDTEIKFGNVMPYSGPASALSITGKAFAAYFDLVNEKGGVNGRKLNMISLDDGFRRQRRSRRHEGWSRTTASPSCSAPWAPRRVRRPQNISTAQKCRTCS
jgi:hypothetical protein